MAPCKQSQQHHHQRWLQITMIPSSRRSIDIVYEKRVAESECDVNCIASTGAQGKTRYRSSAWLNTVYQGIYQASNVFPHLKRFISSLWIVMRLRERNHYFSVFFLSFRASHSLCAAHSFYLLSKLSNESLRRQKKNAREMVVHI